MKIPLEREYKNTINNSIKKLNHLNRKYQINFKDGDDENYSLYYRVYYQVYEILLLQKIYMSSSLRLGKI